jgi:hypothetical protein
LRLAIVGLALILAACGQQTPTATVAVFAPAAHETRLGVLAEQRDATRVEERASRSRTSEGTVQRTEPAPKPVTRRPAAPWRGTPLGTSSGAWPCIRFHESGGNYRRNSGNGYYGAYQFLPATWNTATRGAGYPQYANGRADLAPPAVQDAAAVWLQARSGWGQWPQTSRMCRTR